jgi:hypothetical protein
MKCEVLRHFRIATDAMGVASKELNPGETHDVPDAMLAGLQAEEVEVCRTRIGRVSRPACRRQSGLQRR